MTSHIWKGGFQRPTRVNDNVNLLLVGSRMSDGDEIRRELGIIPGFYYTTWYCSDLEDALDFLRTPDRKIDLIFLDLSLFNADYPKEYFLEVKQAIPATPIVVLTDRTDYDLIEFVMENGAADNISQWQIRNDADRLRSVVQSCCARDKLSKAEGVKNAADLQEVRDRAASDLKEAKVKSEELLHTVQRKNISDNKNMADENRQLKADKVVSDIASGKKIHAAEDALGRSEAELKALQASTTASMLQSSASYAVNIGRLTEENIRLHKDSALHASSIKALEDMHMTAIDNINSKSDAVLLYVQQKDALQLKKAKDENADLRRENLHAKDMLSGGYSAATETVPPVDETPNDKK